MLAPGEWLPDRRLYSHTCNKQGMFLVCRVMSKERHSAATGEAWMVGETPEAWVGQEVLLHLWKSDGLGTEPRTTVLRGINDHGLTVEEPDRRGLTFYPWSTLREITPRQDRGSD